MSNHRHTPIIKRAGTAQASNDSRLLTRDEVEETFGLSKRWLEVAAARGEGPPLVRISRRMVRYRVSDIERWIETCIDRGSREKGVR